MKKNFIYSTAILLLTAILFVDCNKGKISDVIEPTENFISENAFDTSTLKIKDHDFNKIKGQVLYVPVYSNLPTFNLSNKKSKTHNLSGVLAIHNTDLTHSIKITKVLYFNTDGHFVKNFLTQDVVLNPLAATNFYIASEDTSGAGANFIVEWISKVPVSEPLIESIMLDLKSFQGTSFLSKGKVIREEK